MPVCYVVGMQLIVRVIIKFRDDSVQSFDCVDTPLMGDRWLTLYPAGSALSRKAIPIEAVAEVEWDYVAENKKRAQPKKG